MTGERRDEALEERIIAATLRCVARWGIAKTTLEDVAREAGCGRATIYRTFSGGKGALLQAVLQREVARGLAEIDGALRPARSLRELLVAGSVAVSRFLSGHEALGFLLAHEPDAILPRLAFGELEALFTGAAAFAEPHVARFVPAPEARPAAEWIVRVVLSYALNPSSTFDLTKRADAERFVATYLLPSVMPTGHPQPSRS